MEPLTFTEDDARWLASLPLGDVVNGVDMAMLRHNLELTPTQRFEQHFRILECLERADYKFSDDGDAFLQMHDLVLNARRQIGLDV